ncbi:hypothetical protein HG531_003136 [Fusarium graminearum]|nr:hypothetical protein HG531_003136 [Fusarium graminearum]
MHNLGSSKCCLLTSILVSRRYLDNISTNKIQALKPTNDADEFAGGPTARLRGTCARRKGRVENVNVDGEIDGVFSTKHLEDTVYDALCAKVIDIVGSETDPAL